MPSRYKQFDRRRLQVKPLAERVHDLSLSRSLHLDDEPPHFDDERMEVVATRLHAAQTAQRARLLMMGGHVVRAGVSRHLISLISSGAFTAIAMNGAAMIHDFELARIGATTESVPRYLSEGQFGLWQETGELNDWTSHAHRSGEGLGECVGRLINSGNFPHRDISILAAAWRAGVPATVHVGLGSDILHEHPNCHGSAVGETSYRDFLIFAKRVEELEGGALLSFGSAVMAPEVFLKALAMSRNVAHQEGREIRRFLTAVFDIVPIAGDPGAELPKSDPGYYFRPHKTLLVRSVSDGGESFYFNAPHRASIPALHRAWSRMAKA
jgi:hypothetical protein